MRPLGLTMLPWMHRIKIHKSIPRVLADDLNNYTNGEDATINAIHCFLTTNQYITDMRGIAKVNKTYASASDRPARRELTRVWFAHEPALTLRLIPRARDIGVHIETTHRSTGTTDNDRLIRTTHQINTHTHRAPGNPCHQVQYGHRGIYPHGALFLPYYQLCHPALQLLHFCTSWLHNRTQSTPNVTRQVRRDDLLCKIHCVQ